MAFSVGPWGVLCLVRASAVFWLEYVDMKDHIQPEPRTRLVLASLLGVVAAGLAMGAYTLLDMLGIPALDSGGTGWLAAFCFGLIGPIEEGAKILVAWLVVFRWRELDEPIDGFVYAAAIALGCATLENLYLLPGLPWLEPLARTLTLPLTHSLFAAVWGLGTARARLSDDLPARSQRLWIFGAIALSMGLHGLYDFLLLAWETTPLTSALALGVWIFVIARAHELTRQARWRCVALVGEPRPDRPRPVWFAPSAVVGSPKG